MIIRRPVYSAKCDLHRNLHSRFALIKLRKRKKKIFAVTLNLLTSSTSCRPTQTDVEAQILMVIEEAFTLIICFESKVSHVANNVPQGTPRWKYRMRLSCLIQQLKALDEIISPSRLWHSLLVKRAQREKRMEGGGIRGEKGVTFCQKWTHLRTWRSLCLQM